LTITAHFRGGPGDGRMLPLPAAFNHWSFPVHSREDYLEAAAVDLHLKVEQYRRRRDDLHPVSFLHRFGGAPIESFDTFARDLVPVRLQPTNHWIYDHPSAPGVERGYAEVNLPRHLADQPHVLRYMAEGIVGRIGEMGTFHRRDLEWMCWPTGNDHTVRMRCEVVMELAS
jgi:hypothetical protein